MGHLILAFMYLVAVGLLYRIIAYTVTKNPKYKHEYSAVLQDLLILAHMRREREP